MNKLVLILLLLITYASFSQKLTVEETLDYIEKIHNEHNKFKNHPNGLLVRKYEIKSDGFLKVTCYVGNKITSVETAHLNDFSNNVELINDYNSFRVKINCSNRNCFFIKSTPERYENQYEFHFAQEYYAKKLFNAVKYFVALIDESNYERDTDDPFANFNNASVDENYQSSKISLTEKNGTFGIMVSLGNVDEEFTLDTGASETTISNVLEKQMILNGSISQKDYLPEGLYRIADGSIITQRRILLKELSVGPYSVKNIVVSIGNEKSPLLLGKNFLDKFKSWSINNREKSLELSI
jgi:aspartyl protease family protein|tara:strand:+ start:3128 stop:4018 length:891 start_codon:yes stop_codon:yes gene_type:complete